MRKEAGRSTAILLCPVGSGTSEVKRDENLVTGGAGYIGSITTRLFWTQAMT